MPSWPLYTLANTNGTCEFLIKSSEMSRWFSQSHSSRQQWATTENPMQNADLAFNMVIAVQ